MVLGFKSSVKFIAIDGGSSCHKYDLRCGSGVWSGFLNGRSPTEIAATVTSQLLRNAVTGDMGTLEPTHSRPSGKLRKLQHDIASPLDWFNASEEV